MVDNQAMMRVGIAGVACLLACGGDPGAGESGSEGSSGGGASEAAPTGTGTDETGGATGAGGCDGALLMCDGACVDPRHDPAHCGGCETPCPKEQVCVEGQCGVQCGLLASDCGGVCANTTVDPAHCGACGHACAPGVVCVAGACAPSCAAGEAVCGEQCVAIARDEAHCGGCEVACPEGQPCVYGACVDAAVHHVLIAGQSLSTGSGSAVVSAVQPYMNLSFNTGVRAGAAGLTGFIPLVETWDGSQGETIASGLANQVAAQQEALGDSHVILASAHGVGGQPYAALKKGTQPYATGMAQVTAGAAIAGMLGQAYAVRALTIVHGESDHVAGNLGYADDLLAWQSDYEADVAVITGAARPLPMFYCQVSSHTAFGSATSRIPALQLAAARARPDRMYVVGPKYFMPYVDGVHLSGDGERWLGEYYAKVYRSVLIEGTPWRPVQPRTVTREGAVITIGFDVPAPPLVFDEALVSNPGNYGFEYSDASGAPPAIVEVAIVDPTTVRVTLASPPVAGNRRIRYAHTGAAGAPAGPMTGARGNLRDSDATASLNGYALYNWSVHFDEPVE